MIQLKDIKNILVDGKTIGDLEDFQITYTQEQKLITIRYSTSGHSRVLTCELEAVSFES